MCLSIRYSREAGAPIQPAWPPAISLARGRIYLCVAEASPHDVRQRVWVRNPEQAAQSHNPLVQIARERAALGALHDQRLDHSRPALAELGGELR